MCQIIGWWSQKRVPEPYNNIHVYHGIILISCKHSHYIISLIILLTYYVYYISKYFLFLTVSVNYNNYYSSKSPYIKSGIFYVRNVPVSHNAIFIDIMNFGNNHSTFIFGYIVIYYLSSYIISNRYIIFQYVLYFYYLVTKCFNISLSLLIILLFYPLYMIHINATCILSNVGHANVLTYRGYISNHIINIYSIIDSKIFVYHYSITPSLFPESLIHSKKTQIIYFLSTKQNCLSPQLYSIHYFNILV